MFQGLWPKNPPGRRKHYRSSPPTTFIRFNIILKLHVLRTFQTNLTFKKAIFQMVHLLYMSMCSSEVSPRLTMSKWSVQEICQGSGSNIIFFQEYSFQITLRQQWNDKRLRFDKILSSRGVGLGDDRKPRYDMIYKDIIIPSRIYPVSADIPLFSYFSPSCFYSEM